jgi:hypothetical protein
MESAVMRRSLRLLYAPALVLAVAVGTALPASAAGHSPGRPGAMFTLTISAIDRDGSTISSPSATVSGLDGTQYLSGGSSVIVPAGEYIVAAPVWQPSDGGDQTLVADKVHVTSNKHVTLNAQNAVAVTTNLSGTGGATQGPQNVELCVKSGSIFNSVTGFQVDPTATAYLKPMTGTNLETVYQTYWQGTNTLYNLASAHSGGIPSNPVYNQSVSGMAKVHVSLRSGENVTPLTAVIEAYYHTCGSIDEPITDVPAVYTDYRTPGSWNTNLNFGTGGNPAQKDLWKEAVYKAGHTYTDLFDAAANGPGKVYPEIQQHDVVFAPDDLIDDPIVNNGSNCEAQWTISLHRGSTLIKNGAGDFCSGEFSAHAKKIGWYNLDASAVRFNPGGSVPSGILSPSVSIDWHFHFSPVIGHTIDSQDAAVTVTRFVPEGLDFFNEAPSSGTTTVKFYILRAGGDPVPTPVYRLKKVKVQASFNGGTTWQTLTATKHGSYWLAKVDNPLGGYVALRSIVTDVHGDSTTETIQRAYGILDR